MASRLGPGQFHGIVIRSFEADGLRVCETRHEPKSFAQPHDHETSYLCYVLRGSFSERSGRDKTYCARGALVAHPAGERHSDSFGDVGANCLNIELPVGLADQLTSPSHLDTGLPQRALNMLRLELRRPDPFTSLAVQGHVMEILATVLRQRVSESPQASERLAHRLLESPKGAVDQVASQEGIPVASLLRGFRSRYGCTPAQFLRKHRIEQACSMLKGKSELGEIALACGFYDQSHFTNSFRREFGVTPQRYRESLR